MKKTYKNPDFKIIAIEPRYVVNKSGDYGTMGDDGGYGTGSNNDEEQG